jgi:CRP-like cAMP-binding protein
MKQFADFIKSIVTIEENDLEIILSKFTEKTLKKNQLILRKGQIANQYFYIKSGGLRFYNNDHDKQNTAWCFFKDDFFTEISSLNPQIPTRFNIEAIEPTELVVIDKNEMDNLYKQFPVWQEFGRKIWEGISIRQVNQNIQFQTLSAEKMYLEFLKIPDFIQKIPVNQLSSILGITPNALSRIRKNIS